MTARPATVQSLWIGDRLSPIERLCVSSFLHHGHQVELYAYGDLADVPPGVRLMDANDILPQKQVFLHRIGTYAIFSDWFRWELLYRRGGWWVDMDVVCLKPFEFDDPLVFGGDHKLTPGSSRRGEGFCFIDVLRFPAGHPLCKHMIERCAHPNRFTPYDTWRNRARKLQRILLRRGKEFTNWGESGGPYGFTCALEYYGLLRHAKPYEFFSPYTVFPAKQWRRMQVKRFDGDPESLFPNSYSFHIGNEYLRLCRYDKHQPLPEHSLLGLLSKRYQVAQQPGG